VALVDNLRSVSVLTGQRDLRGTPKIFLTQLIRSVGQIIRVDSSAAGPGRSDAECEHWVFVAGQNFDFSSVGWHYHGSAAPVGLCQPFYFDGNEGAANECVFLDQNTVFFRKRFDGGCNARTTDAGMSWSTLFFDQANRRRRFPNGGQRLPLAQSPNPARHGYRNYLD